MQRCGYIIYLQVGYYLNTIMHAADKLQSAAINSKRRLNNLFKTLSILAL